MIFDTDTVNPAPRPRNNGHGHGNGEGNPFPQSRRAFVRGLPRQLEYLESRIKDLELRTLMLGSEVAAIDVLAAARLDNLVEHAGQSEKRLQRVDRRSLQTRRKVAVLADRVGLQLG